MAIMIYPNEQGVSVMGHGLIANALRKQDLPAGVYFFSSPSSIVLFDKELDFCMRDTINDFLNVLQYCKKHNKYLIFPSSATVYNKNTAYAKCKAAIEEIAIAYDIPWLGLRISASFGPGEAHKGEHASVIYQWTKLMMNGESPTIFGDGTQTRDFIYEDDTAGEIARLARENATGFYDIGSGVNTSFNEIVRLINKVLGTNIEPAYVNRPTNYVNSTPVKGVKTLVSLEDGIREIVKSLQ